MKYEPTINETHPSEQLVSLIQQIVRIADPEKIFLLSASYNYQLTENIFLKTPVKECKASTYSLLVLSDGVREKSNLEQQLIIGPRPIDIRNLQLKMMDIHVFNDQVSAGDEYATFILWNAILWFDREKIPLAKPILERI